MRAAAVLVMLACALSGRAFAAEDDLRQQVRTMGRVLEEELSDAMDGGRAITPGLSVLESDVDSEYIPTVGAIYFVRVGFPISGEVAPEPGPEREQAEEEDLWERFSERSWRRGDDRNDDGDFWSAQEDQRNEYEDRLRRRIREQSTHRFAMMDDGDLMRMLHGGGLSYDPEQVEQFRREVIETVGKYGYRMTALPGGERILVVVEAPAQRSWDGSGRSDMGAIRGDRPDRRGPPDVPPPHPPEHAPPRRAPELGPDGPPPAAPPRPPREEGRSSFPPQESPGRAPDALRFLRATMPEFGPKERWLFSFDKSVLTGEKNFDAIAGDVQEQRY